MFAITILNDSHCIIARALTKFLTNMVSFCVCWWVSIQYSYFKAAHHLYGFQSYPNISAENMPSDIRVTVNSNIYAQYHQISIYIVSRHAENKLR